MYLVLEGMHYSNLDLIVASENGGFYFKGLTEDTPSDVGAVARIRVIEGELGPSYGYTLQLEALRDDLVGIVQDGSNVRYLRNRETADLGASGEGSGALRLKSGAGAELDLDYRIQKSQLSLQEAMAAAGQSLNPQIFQFR